MDRTVRILDILVANRIIKITLLAELIGVSQVTLRKDLDNLEKRGIVHRIHGYASLEGVNETGRRMAFNHSVKRKIAKAAVQIVEDNEIIMIESGSCCALFAEELVLAKKNVTIITNSSFIANFICRLPYIKLILLGGYYQQDSQVLVGPMTVKCGEVFLSDKFFLGTDGFNPSYGFTGRDHLRVETMIELTKCSKKNFILTEAAKFHSQGAYNLIQFDKLDSVFTDDSIPEDAEVVLNKNNVTIHKVPSADEIIKWRRIPEQSEFL
jgi:DeoR/GlpR family transcriptional regulator of sugar metabolism